MTPVKSAERTATMQDCIAACEECHRVCVETLAYSLEKGRAHAKPEHVRLLQDCAEICRTAADFMLRGSTSHPSVCAVCAEICTQCARSCDGFRDDNRMKECVEACRRCTTSCREMSGATG